MLVAIAKTRAHLGTLMRLAKDHCIIIQDFETAAKFRDLEKDYNGPGYLDPLISIDRASQKWACFDKNFECVKDFQPYTDEAQALAEAKAWFSLRSIQEPGVVYPQITSMTVSKRKKK